MRIDCTCRHCGKHFTRAPFEIRAGRGRYCSPQCRMDSQRSPLRFTCEVCGTTFHRSPAIIAAWAPRHCSHGCRVAAGYDRRPLADRFWERVTKDDGADGCWEWTETGRNGAGYGGMFVGSKRDGSAQRMEAHRISWELHHGPIPKGMFVCHRCNNPPCVRPDHLYLDTPAGNTHYMIAQDRSARGERAGGARLTEDGVRDIRQRAAAGDPRRVLAAEYGVHVGHIASIVSRRRWKHVE